MRRPGNSKGSAGLHKNWNLRSNGSLEQLNSTGTVLGLFREWDCSIEERRLFSGHTFALYTDGITESFNDAGEEFGVPRLIESLRRHREKSSRSLIASIIDDVQKFGPYEQSDDITLLVAKSR
jgi:sigma-B regulation protein RsbU (phosphoserine phosphatase)